jgi:hypothetical protein
MAQETQIVPYVPWTLALCKEKLQFEEAFAEDTHCALIRPLQPRLVEKIVDLLKETQTKDRKNPLGDFAVVETENGEFAFVMNWPPSWKTNGNNELKKKFAKIAIYDEAKAVAKNEPAGILLWIRPVRPYLKKRLEGKEATYYCAPSSELRSRTEVSSAHAPEVQGACKFYATSPDGVIHEEEKLEIMSEYMEDHSDELTGDIRDVLLFARGFEDLLGSYFIKDCKLQESCIKIFGQWAPNLRTKWYDQKTNMNLKKAQEPIQDWVQIPPSIRKQLTWRMQSKETDIDGNIAEGMCHECSKTIELCKCYCSREHRAINSSELTCACGSKNLKKTIFTYPANCANKTVAGKTSETIQCRDCKAILSVKTPEVKIAPRGAKRSAPPDHVPEWTKRRRK